MPTTQMYEGRAVMFDPNEYPDGWESSITLHDFIAAANHECHSFLPPDWYIHSTNKDYGITDDCVVITVGLERYKDSGNLQPLWHFNLIADPLDEDDTQWIVFDVVRWQPTTAYNFQLP